MKMYCIWWFDILNGFLDMYMGQMSWHHSALIPKNMGLCRILVYPRISWPSAFSPYQHCPSRWLGMGLPNWSRFCARSASKPCPICRCWCGQWTSPAPRLQRGGGINCFRVVLTCGTPKKMYLEIVHPPISRLKLWWTTEIRPMKYWGASYMDQENQVQVVGRGHTQRG